jgi:hypothetical protein
MIFVCSPAAEPPAAVAAQLDTVRIALHGAIGGTGIRAWRRQNRRDTSSKILGKWQANGIAFWGALRPLPQERIAAMNFSYTMRRIESTLLAVFCFLGTLFVTLLLGACAPAEPP